MAYWSGFGLVGCGLALMEAGQREEGLAQIDQGFAAERASGGALDMPYWLALLAELQAKGGSPAEGLTLLDKAMALLHEEGERYAAELFRLTGELTLQTQAEHSVSRLHEVEGYFQKALAIARQQEAKSLELRAATSLARLWQAQGKKQEAHELLAPVYNWFTEGFDTAYLQEAKALHDELS